MISVKKWVVRYEKNNKNVLFLLLLIVSFSGFSQKVIKVDSAIGTCVISNITPEQAKKKAVKEAKNQALLQAGVSEQIMAYSSFQTLSTNDTTIEYFSSLTNVVNQGEVVNWELLSERRFVNEFDNFVYEVVIKASVIKHQIKPDPNFSAHISGLKPVYYEGEPLEFNAEVSQKGFVHVFLINGNEVSPLFPNLYEPQKVFDMSTAHHFPANNDIEYELTLESQNTENNTLAFVYTKNKLTPIIKNDKEFYEWLYLIDIDEVFYTFYSLQILKK